MDFGDDEDMQVPECTVSWQVELPESVICLALSPKEQLVAVGTVEDEIAMLSVDSGEVKFRLAGHDGGTNGVGFLGGNTLVSCGEDGKARVWNIGRQTCLHELAIDAVEADKGPSGFTVSHLTVSPDGTAFAVAAGRSVVLFRLDKAGAAAAPARKTFEPVPSTVEGLRFDRRGNLVVAYYGGVTYIDFSRTEEERQCLDLPYSGACLCADATPNGSWVVAGCHDASVHIYHFKRSEQTGVELEEMTCGGYEGKVTLVDFDARGRYMASAGGERNIVWDFQNSPAGTVPTLTFGHRKTISCQGWQPDGDFLATGGRDGRIYIYDVADAMPGREGMPAMLLPGALADQLGDEVTQMRWASDGRIVAGYLSGFVRLWQLPEAVSDEEEEGGAAAGPAAVASAGGAGGKAGQ